MSQREQVNQLLKEGNLKPIQIAEQVGCTAQYVYQIRSKTKQTEPTETQEPTTEPSTPEKADVTFTFKPVTGKEIPKKPTTIATEFKTAADKGLFTHKELASLFLTINNVISREIGKEYAPDDASALLLGKVWMRPVNRWLGEDIGNWDIVIAGICTAVIYVPTAARIVRKFMEKKSKEKENKTMKKHNVEGEP